jgi:hypothetical protein
MARDPVTGRFVQTANAPESGDGRFATYDELPVEFQGADPADLAYDVTARYAPAADELAQGYGPVMHRRAVMVPPVDDVATRYGNLQGALTRDAARRGTDPMDPSRYLTGAE